MNKNLDLAEILKDCPKGTKLYSPLCGEVALNSVDEDDIYYPIKANCDGLQLTFTRNGKYHRKFNGECMLYPSKDQRDWSKFEIPVKKFDPKTLNPFDKVLVRSSNEFSWRCDLFSHFSQNVVYCVACAWSQMIPYNDETKHLVDTTDMPDEKYIWWED